MSFPVGTATHVPASPNEASWSGVWGPLLAFVDKIIGRQWAKACLSHNEDTKWWGEGPGGGEILAGVCDT